MEPSPPSPPLSPATLRLLRTLLAGQQLQVGAPDFADTARTVLIALAELDAAIGHEGAS